jgi:hypothetical protein
MDSDFRFLVPATRPSNRHGRRDCCLGKGERIWCGTKGSNPSPSSGESSTNPDVGDLGSALWATRWSIRCSLGRSQPFSADRSSCSGCYAAGRWHRLRDSAIRSSDGRAQAGMSNGGGWPGRARPRGPCDGRRICRMTMKKAHPDLGSFHTRDANEGGSVAGRMFVAGIRHQRHRPLVRCDTNFWERLPQPLFHLAARGLGHPKPSRNPRLPRCLSCERLDRRRQFATAHSGGQTAVKVPQAPKRHDQVLFLRCQIGGANNRDRTLSDAQGRTDRERPPPGSRDTLPLPPMARPQSPLSRL